MSFQKEQKLSLLKKRLEERKTEEARLLKAEVEQEVTGISVQELGPFHPHRTEDADGLRNRRNNAEPTSGFPTGLADSALSDMERTASLRGITVLRGREAHIPNRALEEPVESYL